MKIATPRGLKLTAVYGLPGWKPGDHDAQIHIPTVFLSSNRGAIVLRYEREDSAPVALRQGDLVTSGSLAFTDPDGSRHTSSSELRHDGAAAVEPGTQFFTHDGMRTAVALTNVYFGLRDGCILYSKGKKTEALDAVARATGVARLESTTLQSGEIDKEIALLDQLAKNMESEGTIRPRDGGAKERPIIDRPHVPERLPQP